MRNFSSTVRALPLIALSLLFLVPAVALQTANASTVNNGDFQAQSFSKVVDWYDYVRQYAANNGLPQPNATEHAYIYTNYINVGGFQLFYAGLVNATHNGTFVTIPIQTFFEHFDHRRQRRDNCFLIHQPRQLQRVQHRPLPQLTR